VFLRLKWFLDNQKKSVRIASLVKEKIMNTTRRSLIQGLTIGAIAGSALPSFAKQKTQLKGNIRQGACPGAFGRKMPFEKRCELAVKLGLQAMDFITPDKWKALKGYGLECSLTPCNKLQKGLNHVENHAECLANIRESIKLTSEAGFKNVICFSGNREGISDEEGIKNCVIALKQVAGLAEQHKVTLCMELLNSKVNHPDYQCDRTHWGAEVCKQVGSPSVKLLYDIYHMQVQEGDIIATIRKYYEYIAHFHTAGVPGRNDLGDTQELNYPAIMRAILDLGYKGFVVHEYSPKHDPADVALEKAVAICDV
jgi:hydroxypyruvate isomerase